MSVTVRNLIIRCRGTLIDDPFNTEKTAQGW